jgi:hypothetical protein
MALNQFGAVMTFAISLEDTLAEFYASAATHLPDDADELIERSEAAAKRSQKLQRSRRNDITEITLEPIEGLDEANYVIDTATFTQKNIEKIEQTAARFYRDAAPKINVREASRLLERCAKDHTL